MADADGMELVDQEMVYSQCGTKIKADLLGGNAVVLFTYGLSGSGKTYTMFGPEDADAPEAWFKHKEPHKLWVRHNFLIMCVFKYQSISIIGYFSSSSV